MKKLTKQSLDELARTMYVIPESEMDCIIGMYGNDCFWRCVAYMDSGGRMYSSAAAESYALEFYTNAVYGSYPGSSSYANTYLSQNGAGVNISIIQSYIGYAV